MGLEPTTLRLSLIKSHTLYRLSYPGKVLIDVRVIFIQIFPRYALGLSHSSCSRRVQLLRIVVDSKLCARPVEAEISSIFGYS